MPGGLEREWAAERILKTDRQPGQNSLEVNPSTHLPGESGEVSLKKVCPQHASKGKGKVSLMPKGEGTHVKSAGHVKMFDHCTNILERLKKGKDGVTG